MIVFTSWWEVASSLRPTFVLLQIVIIFGRSGIFTSRFLDIGQTDFEHFLHFIYLTVAHWPWQIVWKRRCCHWVMSNGERRVSHSPTNWWAFLFSSCIYHSGRILDFRCVNKWSMSRWFCLFGKCTQMQRDIVPFLLVSVNFVQLKWWNWLRKTTAGRRHEKVSKPSSNRIIRNPLSFFHSQHVYIKVHNVNIVFIPAIFPYHISIGTAPLNRLARCYAFWSIFVH